MSGLPASAMNERPRPGWKRRWRAWTAKNTLTSLEPITLGNWWTIAWRSRMSILLGVAVGIVAARLLVWATLHLGTFALPLLACVLAAYMHARLVVHRLAHARNGYKIGHWRYLWLRQRGVAAAAKRANVRTCSELERLIPPREELAVSPAFAGLDDAAMIEAALELLAETSERQSEREEAA